MKQAQQLILRLMPKRWKSTKDIWTLQKITWWTSRYQSTTRMERLWILLPIKSKIRSHLRFSLRLVSQRASYPQLLWLSNLSISKSTLSRQLSWRTMKTLINHKPKMNLIPLNLILRFQITQKICRAHQMKMETWIIADSSLWIKTLIIKQYLLATFIKPLKEKGAQSKIMAAELIITNFS